MCEDELKINCPRCRKPVVRSQSRPAPFFPFCSQRCKLIDMGQWLDGEHRIEEPLAEREDDLPESGQ